MLLCWAVWLLLHFVHPDLVSWGVRPQHWQSLKGIFFMPLIHDPVDVKHVFNNSIPVFLLLAALVYYYRSIAWWVFSISWLGTGLFVWLFAVDTHSYHIGMSGVVYSLFGFLFISGMLRRVRALQGISLAVIFVYGSMIWGIFPTEARISWEGHLCGFLIGVFLAIVFRKYGPIRQKYRYEIEKEMGIEPPDLEGMWRRNQEELAILREQEEAQRMISSSEIQIVYHFVPKDRKIQPKEEKPEDASEK